MNTEFRCQKCNKKFFEGNLALLVQKKHHDPGETPHIDVQCPRCDHHNVYIYDPSSYVTK